MRAFKSTIVSTFAILNLIACSSAFDIIRVEFLEAQSTKPNSNKFKLVIKDQDNIILVRNYDDGKLVQSRGMIPDSSRSVVLLKIAEIEQNDFFEEVGGMIKEEKYSFRGKGGGQTDHQFGWKRAHFPD